MQALSRSILVPRHLLWVQNQKPIPGSPEAYTANTAHQQSRTRTFCLLPSGCPWLYDLQLVSSTVSSPHHSEGGKGMSVSLSWESPPGAKSTFLLGTEMNATGASPSSRLSLLWGPRKGSWEQVWLGVVLGRAGAAPGQLGVGPTQHWTNNSSCGIWIPNVVTLRVTCPSSQNI